MGSVDQGEDVTQSDGQGGKGSISQFEYVYGILILTNASFTYLLSIIVNSIYHTHPVDNTKVD